MKRKLSSALILGCVVFGAAVAAYASTQSYTRLAVPDEPDTKQNLLQGCAVTAGRSYLRDGSAIFPAPSATNSRNCRRDPIVGRPGVLCLDSLAEFSEHS